MKRLLLLAAAVLVSAPCTAAAPSIHVGAMYEYAEPGKRALLKRVRNTGDATAFVRVQITEVRYAADGTHHEVAVPRKYAPPSAAPIHPCATAA